MVAILMICIAWLLSGILGISIAVNVMRAEKDSMPGGYIWLSLFGPVVLVVILTECVRKATERS